MLIGAGAGRGRRAADDRSLRGRVLGRRRCRSADALAEIEPRSPSVEDADAADEPEEPRRGSTERRRARQQPVEPAEGSDEPVRRRIACTRPVAVALTGGIAAGKSEALAAFARHGAATASSGRVRARRCSPRTRMCVRRSASAGATDAVGDRKRIGEIVFEDPRRARVARAAAAPAHAGARRRVARVASTRPLAVDRDPAPLRDGRRGAVRQGGRDHRAAVSCARSAAAPFADREARLHPRRGEAEAGRLLVCQRRFARRPRRVRRRRGREALIVLRRLIVVAAVAVAAAGAFVYLQRTEPAWWARIWYPLRYSTIVRAHAQQLRPRTRRCSPR